MNFDVVLVLGMHRSGTSAITKSLELFGVNLGTNLLAPKEENPKGFFEDVELVQINDRILAQGCIHWHSIQPLEEELFAGSDLEAERELARKWLNAKVAEGKPFGLKDPRLCRTLRFWKPLFAEFGLRAGYVLAHRNPLEIVASLQERNDLSETYSLSLWATYLADALVNLAGEAWVAMGFNQLLENPRRELSRLADFLGYTWDPANPQVEVYLREFLDARLRHHHFTKTNPLDSIAYQALAINLEAICDHKKGAEPQCLQAAKIARKNIASLSHLFMDSTKTCLEFYFAHQAGAFVGEEKISKKISLPLGVRREISLPVEESARKAIFWRIDPGENPGKISIYDLRFLDKSGQILWDLALQREKVLVLGTATALPLPNQGLQLVSTGTDPILILPPLPARAQVVTIRMVIQVAPVMEGLDALARVQAAQRQHLEQVLLGSQSRVAQLETDLKAKEAATEASLLIQKEVNTVRTETTKLTESVLQLAGRIDEDRKAEAAREAARKGEMEVLRGEIQDGRQQLHKELESNLRELRKEGEAREAARKGEMEGLQKTLIAEVRRLVERQEVKLGEEMAKGEALLATIQAAIEGRAREMAEDQKRNEQRLKEMGSYLGKVQEMAFDPWLNYIPAPFSWPILLFKARGIKRPEWFPRSEAVGHKKPGFWRRLERSIRKRRKRLFAGIGFDPEWYLENHPDVKASGVEPFLHYLEFGLVEGRKKNARHRPRLPKKPGFWRQLKLTLQKKGKQSNRTGFWLRIKKSLIKRKALFICYWKFDRKWYLEEYSDVNKSGLGAFRHYLKFGKNQGRFLSSKEKSRAFNNRKKIGNSQFPVANSEILDNGFLSHSPKISVITVLHNSGKDLAEYLKSLKAQSYKNFEIILFDNNSTDEPEKIINKYYKKLDNLRILKSKVNYGFAQANNLAIENSCGEFLLLLNSDTKLEQDTIEELVKSLKHDNTAAVVAPKILFYTSFQPLKIQMAESFRLCLGTLIESLDYKKWFTRIGKNDMNQICSENKLIEIDIPYQKKSIKLKIFSNQDTVILNDQAVKTTRKGDFHIVKFKSNLKNTFKVINNAGSSEIEDLSPFDRGFGERDAAQYDIKNYIPYFCGCAALIRPSLFAQRKLFLEEFFAYYEDTEASIHVRNNGARILYNPIAKVYHKHSNSFDELSPLRAAIIKRSKSIFLYKNKKIDELSLIQDLDSINLEMPPIVHEYNKKIKQQVSSLGELRANPKKSLAIYNSYWNTLGGGEKHALEIVKLFKGIDEIFLLSETDFDLNKIMKYFKIRVSAKITKVVQSKINSQTTKLFDIFINSTFRSNLISLSKNSYYIVSFPHDNPDPYILSNYTFLFNSDFTHDWAEKIWGPVRSKKIIYPVLGLEIQSDLDQKNNYKFITIGRFNPLGHNKCQKEIVEQFGEATKNTKEIAELKLIGGVDFSNSECAAYYKQCVETAKSYNNIKIFCNQQRTFLENCLRNSLFFISSTGLNFPSTPEYQEHFGIAFLEAILYGCIPIVFDGGQPARFCKDHKIGRIFSNKNDLYQIIKQVIDESHENLMIESQQIKLIANNQLKVMQSTSLLS